MDMTHQMLLDTAHTLTAQRMPKVGPDAMPEQIRQAAKQFEAVFVTQMLEPMFESVSTDGMFGGGHAESVYRSFLVQEIGEQIADQGGFGIAESVAREMLALQEAQSNA